MCGGLEIQWFQDWNNRFHDGHSRCWTAGIGRDVETAPAGRWERVGRLRDCQWSVVLWRYGHDDRRTLSIRSLRAVRVGDGSSEPQAVAEINLERLILQTPTVDF